VKEPELTVVTPEASAVKVQCSENSENGMLREEGVTIEDALALPLKLRSPVVKEPGKLGVNVLF
jgi:hypothetical protein